MWEAPVHVFSSAERASFISILALVLYFSWDAEIRCPAAGVHASVDHDGTLTLRCGGPDILEETRRAFGEEVARSKS